MVFQIYLLLLSRWLVVNLILITIDDGEGPKEKVVVVSQ